MARRDRDRDWRHPDRLSIRRPACNFLIQLPVQSSMTPRRGAEWLLGIVLASSGCAPRCFVKPDEQVQFYPGYAYLSPDKAAWTVVMRGRVVRPDPQSLFS